MNNNSSKNDLTVQTIFNKEKIRERAIDFWDDKNDEEKIKASLKYRHLFDKEDKPPKWNLPFSELSSKQQIIILKGEVIRSYDSLPNIDKTQIKKEYRLSIFSSKWFKLPQKDKFKLLSKLI